MGKIELGELRDQFSLDMQRRLFKILDENDHKSFYYLIVSTTHDRILSARLGRKAIRTVFMITNDIPPIKMLNSACYRVDNERGTLDPVWELPADIPRDDKTVTDETVPEVLENAKGMPIVH